MQRESRKGGAEARIGSLNVEIMTGKGRELTDMMVRRKVDILCVQDTGWKGSKATSFRGGFNGLTMVLIGSEMEWGLS